MSKNGRVTGRSPIDKLENLQVINRHTYDAPRDQSYVYIGRGTPLGNNWSHVAGTSAQFKVETRADAIGEYRGWLWAQIQSGKGPRLSGPERKSLLHCLLPQRQRPWVGLNLKSTRIGASNFW